MVDSRIPHPYRAKAALLGCRYHPAGSGIYESLSLDIDERCSVFLVARPRYFTTHLDGEQFNYNTLEAAFASFVNLIHKAREKENHQ